jgi:hypothetical protein
MQEVLTKPYWRVPDVATYLGFKTVKAAQSWMHRANVRRSKTNKRITTKAWVDAAAEGRRS